MPSFEGAEELRRLEEQELFEEEYTASFARSEDEYQDALRGDPSPALIRRRDQGEDEDDEDDSA